MRMRSLFRRDRAEQELERELRFHLEQQTEEFIQQGLSPRDAHYAALRALGGSEQLKEECRDMRRVNYIENLAQDVRYALRALLHSKGFALGAILSLALGIGANTALFSVIHAVLLRPLPYRDPQQLVLLWQMLPSLGEIRLGATPPEFFYLRDRLHTFSSIAGFDTADFDLTGEGEPDRVHVCHTSRNLFATLGVAPLLGREFAASDEKPGAVDVVILSHAYWQRRFGGNPHAIGSALKLNERTYTVVGVMPAGFAFPASTSTAAEPPAMWMPLAYTAQDQNDGSTTVLARLKPETSMEQARQDVQTVVKEFQRDNAAVYKGNVKLIASVEPWGEEAVSRVRPILYALAGAVVFILLIACANVANLLLARMAARQGELAVRNALGASSARLAQQILAESALLALVAGATGCGLAWALTRAAASISTPEVSLQGIGVDRFALAFTCLISVATGVVCGLAPIWRARKIDINNALRRTGRSIDRPRLRSGLVIAETASATVLLIGAGLLLHSFVEVLRTPPGFDPKGMALIRTAFNRQRYPDPARRRVVEREILARLKALPGVAAAALTTHIPITDEREIGFYPDSRPADEVRWVDNALVSDNYFQAIGIPLLRGRVFTERDTPDTPLTAVINQAMARQFWPGEDPIGKIIHGAGRKLVVVGIVGDVHIQALDAVVRPMIYNSVFQIESGASTSAVFLLRSQSSGATALRSTAQHAIWEVDPGLPVFGAGSLEEIVARSLEMRRLSLQLVAALALLALGLAVVGIYGVLSYAVVQRRRELGVRLALGSAPSQLIRLVVMGGAKLASAGIGLGVLAGAVAAASFTALLFGVKPLDPVAFAGAATLLLAVALLASYLPARRASRIDPLVALREE